MESTILDDLTQYWNKKVNSEEEKLKNEHVNHSDNLQEKFKFDKKEISKVHKNIAKHHIDAFDFALGTCLERA